VSAVIFAYNHNRPGFSDSDLYVKPDSH